VVGSPDTVREGLAAFIERTQADELIITAQVFDHEARKHSYTLVAQQHARLATEAAA
jgi:alkanesulfonate monooxygenase SsuD/methylene tetrahydromethanopterin reductase-like flavin-dependent oxidoreductase (luciferase family)